MRVSVRELKTHLSKYLRLVKTRGESVIVTSRDTAMARLSPVADAGAPKLQQLLQSGLIRWNGRKPKGGRGRPRITGRSAASRVLEDRG
ncbi:MAG: type II toxin-antitoxin system prevent-host-death family antitoxin [Steroidobacteraceae bacterium]